MGPSADNETIRDAGSSGGKYQDRVGKLQVEGVPGSRVETTGSILVEISSEPLSGSLIFSFPSFQQKSNFSPLFQTPLCLSVSGSVCLPSALLLS